MPLLRVVVAVFVLAAAIAAQQPPFEVPLTCSVGANGSNTYPFASPKVVVVGPGGDIWVAGVAQGPGLPILDPDERVPSEDSCCAPGGEPQTPFEPGVVLDPCPDLFAMRLAADGSGAVVSLYGERLGPVEGVAASMKEGRFPTQAGGVRVLVGDTPAPLLYVSATQINAVLPFDLGEDALARVVVERDGVRSNVFAMTVDEAAPGAFQQPRPNSYFGAILNQDRTLNFQANPAVAGSVVSLWATGLGVFSPPLAEGEIVGTTGPFPGLEGETSVEIGGISAEIRYAGAAPGLAAGIVQINFVVPAGLPPGAAWFRIRVGERQSYPFTHIAVHP